MWANMTQVILLILTFVFAILAVELPDLLYSIVSLGGMAVAVGCLFWLLNAPYVAVFQILIYAGAVIVLFVTAVMLTTRRS